MALFLKLLILVHQYIRMHKLNQSTGNMNLHTLNLLTIVTILLHLADSVVVTPVKSYSTATPTWLTSPFFRAGQEAVVTSLIGSAAPPSTYTFTFSSPLPGLPNLAYGIQKYRGNDYIGQQVVEILRTGLTPSSFSVKIQIFFSTYLHLVSVAYLAVDPTFPHHLNSFDNVPINLNAGSIVNISSKSNTLTYYTNYINYTSQSSGRPYNYFTTPLASNRIVLFMTAFGIWANFPDPFQYHIYTQVVNQSFYMWNITIYHQSKITQMGFSQIIFNSDDVQSSEQYYIVYERIYNDANGGFTPVPAEFTDNFIMGVTSFQSIKGQCGFQYQWVFSNSTAGGTTTFGVQILQSVTVNNDCGFSWMESSILYMMTWRCDPPHQYFNLTTRQCQDLCGGFTVQNTTTQRCVPCGNPRCYQCEDNTTDNCTDCASWLFYQLSPDSNCVCMAGFFESSSTCQSCGSANPGCSNCSYDDGANGTLPFNISLFTCQDCNQTAGYYYNVISEQCSTICGDGIVVGGVQGCDDNNTDSLDGCSSTCSIQSGFVCSGGPSQCSFNPNASLSLYSQDMENESIACNTITFGLSLSPASDVFTRPDIAWDSFISTPNASLIQLNSSLLNYSSGVLYVSYYLLADLQNSTLVFEANFSTLLPDTSIFDSTTSPPLSLTVSTTPEALRACCTGYFMNLSTIICEEICGDGFLYELPCDDGNQVDGDGCSSECLIQPDYACTNGTPTTSSVCSFNGTISFAFQSGDKNPDKNSMTLTYNVDNFDMIISQNNGSTDFSAWVTFPNSSGVTVTSATIDPLTGKLVIQINYSQDLQDKELTFQMVPPNIPETFATTYPNHIWTVQPTNQLAAVVYEDQDYQTGKKLKILCYVIVGSYLSCMFLAMVYRKFQGLELATLIQMGYLSLLHNKEITVYSEPILNWRYVFGYNDYYFSTEPVERLFSPFDLYSYEKHFGFSNNLMLMITFLFYLIALSFFILSKMSRFKTSQRLFAVSYFIANNICYTLMVFLTPNILIAMYIELNEGVIIDWSLLWSKIFMIGANSMLVFAHVLATYTAYQNSDVGTFLDRRIALGVHMPVVFNIRLFLLTSLLFTYHLKGIPSLFLTLFLQVGYIIFVVLARPHLKKYDIFRSFCLECGLLCIFLMRTGEIYGLAEKVDPRSIWFIIVAYFEYIIYIVGIILTVISLIYHCCCVSQEKKIKQKKQQSDPSGNITQTQQNIKSEKVSNISDIFNTTDIVNNNAVLNKDKKQYDRSNAFIFNPDDLDQIPEQVEELEVVVRKTRKNGQRKQIGQRLEKNQIKQTGDPEMINNLKKMRNRRKVDWNKNWFSIDQL